MGGSRSWAASFILDPVIASFLEASGLHYLSYSLRVVFKSSSLEVPEVDGEG